MPFLSFFFLPLHSIRSTLFSPLSSLTLSPYKKLTSASYFATLTLTHTHFQAAPQTYNKQKYTRKKMSPMEEVADMASVEAVQGARYVLGVLPEVDIYNIYVAPVLYYFEKKDGASLGVVRIALRGLVVAVLMLVVSLFGFLSMMNVACLCVTSLAMGVMEVKKKKKSGFRSALFVFFCYAGLLSSPSVMVT